MSDDDANISTETEAVRFGKQPATDGNDVQLLVGGHEVLPKIVDAIATAESSIHIEVMLFFNDDAGYQIRDALLRRIDETGGWVKVRVLYDYLATVLGDPFLSKGSNPLQLTTFMAPPRGAGAEVIDTSFSSDQDPRRMERLESLIPTELRESVLNFPYEVGRSYRRMRAGDSSSSAPRSGRSECSACWSLGRSSMFNTRNARKDIIDLRPKKSAILSRFGQPIGTGNGYV